MSQRNRDKQKHKRREAARARAIEADQVARDKRRRLSARIATLTTKAAAVLQEQEQRFVDKFGRKPTEKDPVWFDPDKDEPTEMDIRNVTERAVHFAEVLGIRPEVVHALRKTGMMIYDGNRHAFSPDEIRKWESALAEYRASHKEESRSSAREPDWLRILKE